jgi:hypothetical protein
MFCIPDSECGGHWRARNVSQIACLNVNFLNGGGPVDGHRDFSASLEDFSMTRFYQLTATAWMAALSQWPTMREGGFGRQYRQPVWLYAAIPGLEALYKYADQGLVVLGFPCNQFGKQEPGGADEISKTCHINYGVSFPMFEKERLTATRRTRCFVI